MGELEGAVLVDGDDVAPLTAFIPVCADLRLGCMPILSFIPHPAVRVVGTDIAFVAYTWQVHTVVVCVLFLLCFYRSIPVSASLTKRLVSRRDIMTISDSTRVQTIHLS